MTVDGFDGLWPAFVSLEIILRASADRGHCDPAWRLQERSDVATLSSTHSDGPELPARNLFGGNAHIPSGIKACRLYAAFIIRKDFTVATRCLHESAHENA
jgi:hypothetical protein